MMTERPALRDRLTATLLATALGDALGLCAEGMSPRAIARRFGRIDRFHLLGSIGFVSDDTEQSALVAQSLSRHPTDVVRATRAFKRSLLGWFLRLPWGIGLATLRACLRIAFGFARTGVRSAGNGAAMRAGVLGCFYRDDLPLRRAMSDAFAEVTHTDPRGVQGARFTAELAALCALEPSTDIDRAALCTRALGCVDHPELRAVIASAIALGSSDTPGGECAATLGTTGFVMHTVPFAVFSFIRHGSSVLHCLTEVIAAGGDTDSIAAVVGGWLGALHGTAGLPSELLGRLQDGPFGPTHLRALATDLSAGEPAKPTARYSWVYAMARNLALYPVILGHGFRRLIPW